jgi:hypothetical protein
MRGFSSRETFPQARIWPFGTRRRHRVPRSRTLDGSTIQGYFQRVTRFALLVALARAASELVSLFDVELASEESSEAHRFARMPLASTRRNGRTPERDRRDLFCVRSRASRASAVRRPRRSGAQGVVFLHGLRPFGLRLVPDRARMSSSGMRPARAMPFAHRTRGTRIAGNVAQLCIAG